MVLRPVYDSSADMPGYPPSGASPAYNQGEPDQRSGSSSQWRAYQPPPSGSPYPPPGSSMASPPPGSPYSAPGQQTNGGYYGPPQPTYAGSPPPAGQYPPPGSAYNQSPYQSQSYYQPPGQQSPYQPPAQPQYAHSPQPSPYQAPAQPQYVPSPQPSPGHPPEIKNEYSSPPPPGQIPQTDAERGLLGALAGGAAGAFAGHKVNHGFLGALGGAFAGHKLQDAYKDHKKPSRPSSRRSSSSSSSSSDDGKHHKYRPQKPYGAPRPAAAAPVAQPSPRGNFSLSSARISLDGDHDLIAECGAIDGRRKLSSISLNRLLTNDDGHFRWAREGNFAASARNVRLAEGGRFLEAELCTVNGSWRWDRIDLDEKVENSDGNLQVLW